MLSAAERRERGRLAAYENLAKRPPGQVTEAARRGFLKRFEAKADPDGTLPGCGTVEAAGEFRPLRYGSGWRQVGRMLRRCPACGHRAPTRFFVVVRDTRRRRP